MIKTIKIRKIQSSNSIKSLIDGAAVGTTSIGSSLIATALRTKTLTGKALLIIFIALCGQPAFGEAVAISLSDHKDKPLKNAVVSFKPMNAISNETPKSTATTIAQINKEFEPEVSVVQAGTAIKFPNKDNILHHVYSFSSAKTFDLPLYKGVPAEPIVFDTPGLVTLGCNIHDWMRAYVVVVDTPYYKISADNGTVSINGIPSGEYEMEVWHPRQRKVYKDIVEISQDFSLSLTITTKPQLRSRRNSAGGKRKYGN